MSSSSISNPPKGEKCTYMNAMFPAYPELKLDQLVITKQGLYSVTPAVYSKELSNIIIATVNKGSIPVTIVDMTANNGGDTLAFATAGMKVIAFESDPEEYKVLVHNIQQYPLVVRQNITARNESCILLSEVDVDIPELGVTPDVIYFDPPWGGGNYKEAMKDGSFELLLSYNDQEESVGSYIVFLFELLPQLQFIFCKVPLGFRFKERKENRVIKFKKHEVLMFKQQ